jgi:hypothetical protein
MLNKYAKNKITKDKFIITSALKEGKVGVKKVNPCNGKFRANAKEIFISLEKLEIL